MRAVSVKTGKPSAHQCALTEIVQIDFKQQLPKRNKKTKRTKLPTINKQTNRKIEKETSKNSKRTKQKIQQKDKINK